MLTSALEAIPVPACAFRADGMIVAHNAAWRAFGEEAGAPPEFCGTGVRYLDVLSQGCTPSAVLADLTRAFDEVRGGLTSEFVTDFDCDAFVEPVRIRLRATQFVFDGEPLVVVSHTDRAELTAAHSASSEASERLELAADGAELGMWDYDLVTGKLVWDERMLRLFDMTPETFDGTAWSWQRRLHPDDAEHALHELELALSGQRAFNTRFRVVHDDGRVLTLRGVARVHRGADGAPTRMVGANWDITEEARNEAELRTILQTLPDALVVLDADGLVVRANAAVADLFGVSERELLHRRVDTYFDDVLPLHEAQSGRNVERELTTRRTDGRTFPTRVTLTRLPPRSAFDGFVVTAQDLTERARLQEKLQRSERFEAMGRLAGAVAHDFNNLLVAILTGAELIAARAAGNQRIEPLADNVLEAARRARDLTAQLLLLSRQRSVPDERIDVAAELEGVVRAIGPSIPDGISLHVDAPRGLLAAIGSPQLHQIVSNLVINSRDALGGQGTIEVQVARAVDDDTILLFVRDNGPGIPEHLLPTVFEPFVTSKTSAHGTGLGLAIVYATVAKAGGSVMVSNRPGGGCEFVVQLRPAQVAQSRTAAATDSDSLLAGTVLLVDDDALVLDAVASSLEDLGLKVLRCPDATSALTRLDSEPVDLVLSDIAMPGMLGTELALRVRAQHPSLPILLMTGYTTEDLSDVIERTGVKQVLHKPFAQPDLRRAVRDALSARVLA